MFQDLFVPRKLVDSLLSLGFNDPCLGYWDNRNELRITSPPYLQSSLPEGVVAPIYQQIMNWFMTTHRIWINPTTVYPFSEERRFKGFSYYIAIWDEQKNMIKDLQPYNDESWEKTWPTYPEAVDESIKEAIKIITYRQL